MLLKEQSTGEQVEVLDLAQLFSLYDPDIEVRYCGGEKKDTSASLSKTQLTFISGEQLPRCWLDPHYRD